VLSLVAVVVVKLQATAPPQVMVVLAVAVLVE
jgi:hypothetical protein